VLLPLLSISQQFSLLFSFPLATATSYVNGSESFQEQFLVDEIEPVGSVLGGPFFHSSLLVDAAWMASPTDICNAYARLRTVPSGTQAFEIVDRAMSASVAQPDVRNAWDRVWYKGGSLFGTDGTVPSEQRVLTHAWFLESAERGRFFVAALANNPRQGNGSIDDFVVQSLTSRMLQLVSELDP